MLTVHDVPFAPREYPSFTEGHLAAILHMREITIMREMRSLFDALFLMSLIVAAGTALAITFR